MDKIIKHSFEAVSLLTKGNGMLEVTVIPALNQPDWIIPSALILDSFDCNQWTQSYSWQQQEIAVFHLLAAEQAPDKIVILEGNTAAYRLALQTQGQLRTLQIRISDVKDSELPDQYANKADTASSKSVEQVADDHYLDEKVISSYLYQTVTIENTAYLIADLDKIAYTLADKNSSTLS